MFSLPSMTSLTSKELSGPSLSSFEIRMTLSANMLSYSTTSSIYLLFALAKTFDLEDFLDYEPEFFIFLTESNPAGCAAAATYLVDVLSTS
jgi:hypothetical protein